MKQTHYREISLRIKIFQIAVLKFLKKESMYKKGVFKAKVDLKN
jgi:hypothetical protein